MSPRAAAFARGLLATRPRRAAGWALLIGAVLELVARHYIAGPLDLLRPSQDPELVFEIKPGHYESDGYLHRIAEVTYDIDADGCRRWGGPAPRTALAFFGSSLAFGLGVPLEQTFPHRAWASLAARRSPGALPAVNCSVPGHNLLQTVRGAALVAQRERPRVVAVLLHPFHMRAVYDWSSLTPRSPPLRWLTRHVRVARIAYLVYLVRSSHDFATDYESPARLASALDRLAATLRATDGRAVFFLLGEMRHPGFDLTRALDARGIAWRVITAPTHDETLDGDHWSARGHAAVAARIEGALAETLAATR